jgi:hypothetical protein
MFAWRRQVFLVLVKREAYLCAGDQIAVDQVTRV